jgi:hypothetical protein
MRAIVACASALSLSAGVAGAQVQQAVPQNASPARTPPGWQCNAGFIERSASCVSLSDATDGEVKQFLIRRSISAYSGSCPCPFNVDRAGRRCGGRSAYSRPGGRSPQCYESDVSAAQVAEMRAQFRKKSPS